MHSSADNGAPALHYSLPLSQRELRGQSKVPFCRLAPSGGSLPEVSSLAPLLRSYNGIIVVAPRPFVKRRFRSRNVRHGMKARALFAGQADSISLLIADDPDEIFVAQIHVENPFLPFQADIIVGISFDHHRGDDLVHPGALFKILRPGALDPVGFQQLAVVALALLHRIPDGHPLIFLHVDHGVLFHQARAVL